jgi:hypothetical protein
MTDKPKYKKCPLCGKYTDYGGFDFAASQIRSITQEIWAMYNRSPTSLG